MVTILQVAIGGALGAVLRYVVGMSVAFPMGTITVNVVGSFLMGMAFVYLSDRSYAPFVMIGALGGFTTFSAFSLDVFKLYELERFWAAGGYVLGTVIGSVVALVAGIYLARALA